MAPSMKAVIALAVIGLILFEVTECRRGGGGGRGGSRGGSRGSSRGSRGGSSGSRVRMYRGPSYTRGSWKTAAAAGVVFGLASYKTRRMYRSHPNREPAICFNEKNLRNGTGYFVCPQKYNTDDMASCCGPDDEEYCCKGLSGGAIAGIVIGIVVVIIIVVGVCVYCKYKSKRRAKSGEVISAPPKTENQPLNPSAVYKPSQNDAPVSWNTPNDGTLPYNPNPAAPPYGYQPVGAGGFAAPAPYPPQQYGMQEPGTGPIGFDEPNKYPMPQGDVSGGLPYPTNPGMPYNPQGQPTVAPPPYPAN